MVIACFKYLVGLFLEEFLDILGLRLLEVTLTLVTDKFS